MRIFNSVCGRGVRFSSLRSGNHQRDVFACRKFNLFSLACQTFGVLVDSGRHYPATMDAPTEDAVFQMMRKEKTNPQWSICRGSK